MSYYRRVHVKNKYKIDPNIANFMFESWLVNNNIGFEKFKIIDLNTVDVWFRSKQDYFIYEMLKP
jgi:hypothetical protein